MKNLLLMFVLLLNGVTADTDRKSVKKLSVKEKKKRFYSLVVPVIDTVYKKRYIVYKNISKDINKSQYSAKVEELKKYYKVKTDKELLMALKPLPKSIAIAQAAMESAWGTSRFFKVANNLFGMWSINAKEQRVAAGKKRDNNVTVWVKKYDTLEGSVQGYYITLAKGRQYKKMRELNYKSDDVFEIVNGLDKYSERGKSYVDEISSIIRYNKLTTYDKN